MLPAPVPGPRRPARSGAGARAVGLDFGGRLWSDAAQIIVRPDGVQHEVQVAPAEARTALPSYPIAVRVAPRAPPCGPGSGGFRAAALMDPAEEEDLVQRVRDDGADGRIAYDTLVREHQHWLVRYLAYVLGSQSEAEDVAQEVLVKAYMSMHLYRGDAPLKSWLRSIATRMAFNNRRQAATRRRYEERASAEAPATPSAGPEGAVVARDVLLTLLTQLPYAYREIMVLRYVEELSAAEIAETLGIGLSAGKMRLKRAREAFWALHDTAVVRGD